MIINQSRIIQLILGICVYFTISCDGCNQKQIGRGTDQAILKIKTQAVSVLGSIDKTNLVLDVVGKIEVNQIKESSVLCVVVIPVGGSIENATNELRSIPKSFDKDTKCISLPTNQGAAYYGMEWSSNQTGNVATRVYLKDILIPKQYGAYLVVHNILYGTYHSKQGQLFDIPAIDPANVTTIELQSAVSKRVVDIAAGESFVEIMAQADAKNFGTMGGGFLFIEKKDVKVNPDSLLVEAIKGGKIVPTVNEFNLFTTNPDAIVHSFIDMARVVSQAQANNNISSRDVAKLFKKGGTYQVYAYLMHTVDGQVHYIVSKEDIVINIYKPEVELEMIGANIINIIKDLSSPKNMPVEDYNSIKIALSGKLTKHLNTFNPQIGFLFIADGTVASPNDAKNKITSFLTASPGVNQDALYKHGDDLIYMAANISSGVIGQAEFMAVSSNILLKLGKQYTIYFWLQDGGGEVFVSSNSVKIAVPRVELTINKFTTYRILNNFYVDRLEHIAVNGSDILFWGCWGYILVAKGKNFDKAFLTTILQEEENKRANPPKSPGNILARDHMILFRSDIGFISGGPSPTNLMNKLDEAFRQLPSKTEYDIYLTCFNDKFIFYTKADHPDKKFVWQQPPNAIREYQVNNIIVQQDLPMKNYQVICQLNPMDGEIVKAHILEKHATDNGTDEIKYKQDNSNVGLITKILTTNTTDTQGGTEAIFSGSPEHCEQAVKNFISKMTIE